jgi:hypothetical protein
MVKMIEVNFDSSSIEKPLKLLSYSFVIYKDKNKIYEELFGLSNVILTPHIAGIFKRCKN